MTLRDWPDEPCAECREFARQETGVTPPDPKWEKEWGSHDHYHGTSVNYLEALANAARRVHGGSAGREMAESYEAAREVLRRVWSSS